MAKKHFQFLRGLLLAAAIAVTMPPALALDADAEGWIAFDASEGQIALVGKINGEPVRVLLDSTVNASVISSALAERAGIREDRKLEFRVGEKRGDKTVFGSRRFQLQVGDSTLNFGGLPILPGDDFDMRIGHQVFEEAVVQIDYPNERFRLLPRKAVQFEGNVPARRGAFGELLIETRIHGDSAWLMLDTGLAGATVLKGNFVSENRLDARRVGADPSTEHDDQKPKRYHLLQLDDVELGPYRFERFLAQYVDDQSGAMEAAFDMTGTRIRQGRSNHDGLLGFEILKNFLVTADFSSGKLHLQAP